MKTIYEMVLAVIIFIVLLCVLSVFSIHLKILWVRIKIIGCDVRLGYAKTQNFVLIKIKNLLEKLI